MLYIALCDRNEDHLEQVKRCIVSILFDKCDFKIDQFTDTTQFISDMVSGKTKYDLILTEQDVKPYSGIQIAKIVSQYKLLTKVIFITDDISYVIEGYKYEVFDYLMKPVSFEQIKNTINRYIGYNTEHFEYFSYMVRNKIKKVKMDKIIYFESVGRKIMLATNEEKEEFYGRLDEIEAKMKVTFFLRVHQSYLVNVHYIRNIFKSQLVLDNGKVIPISRSRRNNIKDKFINYLSEGN